MVYKASSSSTREFIEKLCLKKQKQTNKQKTKKGEIITNDVIPNMHLEYSKSTNK